MNFSGIIGITIWCFSFLCSWLFAGSAELTWDVHPELDVTGYIVYWSTSAQPQDSMDVGKVERALIDNLSDNTNYNLWVRAYDRSRNLGALSSPLNFKTDGTVINSSPKAAVNNAAFVSGLPNPFSRTAKIVLDLGLHGPSHSNDAIIEIYDIKGLKVRSDKMARAGDGHFQYSWNGTNDYAEYMSSGLYLVKMILGGHHIYKGKLVYHEQ